ncbi:sigma-70 family RNA polymerase sigma factor [Tautonia rosea]|uniref:sigma-70 family RNA polymerase sigma factor n=1 Tax=Tautonia rosea TaxID=2728037 RepID=UPI00147405D4|nr:sigma-70 family RNA polymerase sigma factor [Tautonia rosea]
MNDLTQILSAIEQGDPLASEQLLPLVYDELRTLAATHLARERPGQTLQATALVHEAYLRLIDPSSPIEWDGRGHFFKAAAEAMRRILVDRYRRKCRLRHGGDHQRLDFEVAIDSIASPGPDLAALDDALNALAQHDPTSVEVVKLRYFVGLTIVEIAQVLEIAPRTVDRHWAYARAWLHHKLSEE